MQYMQMNALTIVISFYFFTEKFFHNPLADVVHSKYSFTYLLTIMTLSLSTPYKTKVNTLCTKCYAESLLHRLIDRPLSCQNGYWLPPGHITGIRVMDIETGTQVPIPITRLYHLVSFSSQTMCLLSWQSWLKTGLPPAAVNTLAKMNGHQTGRTLTLLIVTCGELCLNTRRHFIFSQRTLMDWRKSCINMGLAATRFSQQGRTELVWKLGWMFRTCFEINCLVLLKTEHYKWLSIFSV